MALSVKAKIAPADKENRIGLAEIITSAQSFGPVMRFVYGAKYASAIVASHIRFAAGKCRG